MAEAPAQRLPERAATALARVSVSELPRPTGAQEGNDGAEAAHREHLSHVVRLRRVLGVGLFLWNVIGIPNDFLVTENFGLSYREFTFARVISSAVQLLAWGAMFLSPSPRMLRWLETICFCATAAGLAALHHGIAGPTPLFLSCAMLAQGVALPRPWRQGLLQVGATYLAYPITFVGVELLTHRGLAAWSDPVLVVAFGRHLLFAGFTCAFVVMGADALYRAQRSARKEQQVGQYSLLSRLGGGAMGEVWLARHPGLGQEVALKLAAPGKEALSVREADILVRLKHPATVRIVDRGATAAGRPYFAMERLRGLTLDAQVTRDGPLSAAEVRSLGGVLARALAELHAMGWVHRDVTPHNIVLSFWKSHPRFPMGASPPNPAEDSFVSMERHSLSSPRSPRLIDFGLAVPVGSGDAPGAGSLRYCPQEQRQGASADRRMDVFAIGAVLHFALTGRSPLDGEGAARLPLPRISLPSGLPEDLKCVVSRCLAPEPHARFADAHEVAEALLATCDGS